MKQRLLNLLGVEEADSGPVLMLLGISFLMGLFLATVTVASQTLFLNGFDERKDLPLALVVSGGFALAATTIFTFLQGRMPFRLLALGCLIIILGLTAFIEYGEQWVSSPDYLHYFGFTMILPFTLISMLVFWGSFNRMFNLRQQKKVIGSVDVGLDIASIIAFFSIPLLLNAGLPVDSLFTIGLFSAAAFLVLFFILSQKYLKGENMAIRHESDIEKLSIGKFFRNKYILQMSAFIILALIALRFVDYAFFNVSTQRFNNEDLPYFLSYFEMTIVLFSFVFTTFITEWITQNYGLRVTLLINPILLIAFTGLAVLAGWIYGFDATAGESLMFFFLMVAMSKLFINSLHDAVDDPTFKMYYVPIDKGHKIDAQTKIEGVVIAIGSILAGGLIVLINQFPIFNLLSVTAFTLLFLGLWYWTTNRMYHGYKDTLQGSLVKNKSSVEKDVIKEYTLDSVLEKEVKSTAEDKVIYGLKLMEKLEPALFESSIITLATSNLRKVKEFANDKIQELGINTDDHNEIKGLAQRAAGESEDSDLLSISPERLMKLSKSVKQTDRILAAKLLRKLVSAKTIFILLELLRDADPKVRSEALLTARKIKRPETWPVLIDMLSSPGYSHQAASALKEAGSPALNVLETSFHKSSQSDLVMLKIIQIIGHIGSKEAIDLLWKKADYPDKRIVKQILYSLRFINYQAKGREASTVKDLLDIEMSKTLWNLAAIDELPNLDHFEFMHSALREEVRDNYDHITLLLSMLYDPQSVQLVKENIELGTPDGTAYALELLDLFVDKDLKATLIPLLDDSPTKEKLEKLQTYFPRENYNAIQVINYVLNRDFNLNNRWSKLCAVHASAYIPDFRISRGLISQMFNQDKLIQETAAWVIYNKDKHLYDTISERLPVKDKKFLDSSIENNKLLDGLDDGFFLGIEMVMFIKELPAFKGIAGNLLCDLTDKIIPLDLKTREKVNLKADDNNLILIVAIGEVRLKNEDQEIVTLKSGDVFGDIFQEGTAEKITTLEAVERSVVFRINITDFYFVLANHHELVQGLIKNIVKKQKKTLAD
jgi:AAA family ATP:ADP antiporter